MNVSDLIRRHEGLRLKPYRDSLGFLSIGYGRNLDGVGIHTDEAELMFQNDLNRVQDRCALMIPDWDGYDAVRQGVLLDLCYNLGIAGLLKFQRFLLAMHLKNWRQAHDELLDSLYAKQVPTRAIELAGMIITGGWPEE